MNMDKANWTGVELASGRYQIMRKLGEGGFAHVYLARARRLDKDVVIKVPKQHILDDPEFAKRVVPQSHLLAKLVHPHIVKILDVDEHKGIPFAVMEYCAGVTLDDLRPKGPDGKPVPVSPGQLCGWLPHICEALDYVHREGYVHRDVKPGNILFDEEANVYLGGFGIAKPLEDTATGMVLGNPAYMAPEIILGRDFDGRADQYSAAAAVFDLLAGRPPFDDPTPSGILVAHATQPPPLLHQLQPDVSWAVSAVVDKGLSKNADDRYRDCAAFCQALMSAIGHDRAPNERRIPTGTWIRLGLPGVQHFVGYTYVDPTAGFSAKGGRVRRGVFDAKSDIIVRLQPSDSEWEALSDDEITELGLEATPAWVEEFYGPQPKQGTLWGWWQDHPKLRARFHPEYPNDLQVAVHDGGPRVSDRGAEVVWVRVVGGEGDVFVGHVLNAPHRLQSVSQGSLVKFIVPDGGEYPLMVTEKYLDERADWTIHPCQKCGLAELFDAPSDLLRIVFPDAPEDAEPVKFTAFCGVCGGVQVVEYKAAGGEEATRINPPPRKPWWRFWR